MNVQAASVGVWALPKRRDEKDEKRWVRHLKTSASNEASFSAQAASVGVWALPKRRDEKDEKR
ncbi:hypothetical protein [Sulfurospirillum cavolei]|uniref:hypothetical protein n=1 Tax=Sulfurospirillum cavolei TaxID=366522 RepID=UPI0005A73B66|nr:hypothetical protein [Sulfurospirillum cavolei]